MDMAACGMKVCYKFLHDGVTKVIGVLPSGS